MGEVSRDGPRVYFTSSLYAAWDEQLNPEGVTGWIAKVNVDTRGFAPGDYTLRVSFSSPTLTGSFTKQTTVTADASTSTTGKDKDKSDKDKSDKDKKEK